LAQVSSGATPLSTVFFAANEATTIPHRRIIHHKVSDSNSALLLREVFMPEISARTPPLIFNPMLLIYRGNLVL
jgi:hypothetical protein